MENTTITVGTKVTRLSSDYTNGRTGEVVAINDENTRAQVAWDGFSTTWVSFRYLEVNEPAPAAEPPAAEHPAEDFASLVGSQVIRKCGTAGTIDAYADGKFTITLTDGRVKKPGAKLFRQNYKVAEVTA